MASASPGPATLRAPPGRLRGLLNPAEWSVRRKVIAALAVPIATALAISGVRLSDLVQAADGFSRDAAVSRAQQATGELVREVGAEQVAVAAVLVGLSRDDPAVSSAVRDPAEQRARTDAAVRQTLDRAAAFTDESDEVRTRLRSVEGAVERTRVLRDDVAAVTAGAEPIGGEDAAELVRAYSDLSGAALRLGDALTGELVDGSVQQQGASAQALSEAYRQSSLQDALTLVVLGLTAGPDEPLRVTVEELVASEAARVNSITDFEGVAAPDVQARFGEEVAGSDVGRDRSRAFQLVLISLGDGPVVTAPPAPPQWVSGATAVRNALDRLRSDISAAQVDRADTLQDQQLTRAAVEAAVVLAALVLGLLVTVALGTLIVRPLSTLRREAMETAERHLPAAITRLREDGPDADVAVRPISVRTREEVGQAARAFEAVSERAVLLAMEQEALRAGLSDVIVNLSRRSQTLVERQLLIIDRLERDEESPDQLDQLFRLDHLASRMRRYNDNLLILAGGNRSRRTSEALSLLDVLRAATSEIEQYTRVRVLGAPAVTVSSHAAATLIHLVAELLDNATTYSDPQSEVEVSVHGRVGQVLMIAIADHGIGFDEERLAEANLKLAEPPLVDPVADEGARRQMGLYVVGQLAKNLGIRVQLRPNAASAGTVAEVLVPPEAFLPTGRTDDGTFETRESTTATGPQPALTRPRPSVPARIAARAQAPSAEPTDPSPPAPPSTPPPPTTTREETPLFDELSAWFRSQPSSTVESTADTSGGTGTGVPGRTFAGPADEGWKVVAALEEVDPAADVTAAGLPRRRPQANLVPGGIDGSRGPGSAEAAPVAREADGVRSRLSSLQRGVRAGRSRRPEDPDDASAPDAPSDLAAVEQGRSG